MLILLQNQSASPSHLANVLHFIEGALKAAAHILAKKSQEICVK